MMRTMCGRERLEAAFNRAPVDTVPIAPDIWLYWPARFSGRKYWELDGPLALKQIWRTHLKVNRDFGLDALVPVWLGDSPLQPPETITVVEENEERRVVEVRSDTPAGPMIRRWTVFADDAACVMDYPIRTREDFAKLDYFFFIDPRSRDTTDLREAAAAIGRDGLIMTPVSDPFSQWQHLRGVQPTIMDLMDRPGEMHELFRHITAQSIVSAQTAIEAGARVIMTAGSSTSLLSPRLFREFCVPYLREFCTAVRAAGGYTLSHHHGRCRAILDEIDSYGADMIEPLEERPLGDVELDEVKQRIGTKCALKGNVNTVEVLLLGSPDDVKRAVSGCMAAAKEGYGYVLSTGDQVARDTPLRNFRAFVESGRRYGVY